MDAMKFIEERNRMCNSFETCGMCPAFEFSCTELPRSLLATSATGEPATAGISPIWRSTTRRRD